MPLETLLAARSITQGAENAIAHGLTHGGASQTPHFFVILPQGTSNMTFSYTCTFDSRTLLITAGAGTTITAQVFVKRCHTIED